MFALLFLALGYGWGRYSNRDSAPPALEGASGIAAREEPQTEERHAYRSPAPESSPVEQPAPQAKEPPPAPGLAPGPVPVDPGAARVALVIDDLGRSPSDVDRLEALGIEWTAAVLPFESRTDEVVAALRGRGVEYLCHLPMEPTQGNPGPGALRTDMSASELTLATRSALDSVPGAVGVNNHMGSVLSANAGAMAPILGEIAVRRLFYLDSRTSAESVGYRLALELGLAATERQVFLDSDPGEPAIEGQFRRLLDEARRRGSALAIGHPYPQTFDVLAREVPRALAAGYEFVPASFLLDRPALTMDEQMP